MTPDQLARNNTESGHQKAFFAWCAMARLHGFAAADDPASYKAPGWLGLSEPVPALEWLHSIPNGGARDPATAARMKAEGVKRGIPDIFLPFPRRNSHGLYIEFKKLDGGSESKEQKDFKNYCDRLGYAMFFCYGWKSAVETLKKYLRNEFF